MSELNDLVGQYQLSLTHLQTKCDDELFLNLSEQISSFEDTAPYFELTQPETDEIIVDCRTERSRTLRMLWNWKTTHGSKATYLAIVNIFLRLKDRYLAEFVLRYCKGLFESHFQEQSEEHVDSVPKRPRTDLEGLDEVPCQSTIQRKRPHDIFDQSLMVDDRPLKEDDLRSVMEETHSINDWSVMGLALDVPPNVIERSKRESLTVQNCQYKILYHWLGMGCASWAKLVKTLHSPLVCKKGLAGEIAKKHPCEEHVDSVPKIPRTDLKGLDEVPCQSTIQRKRPHDIIDTTHKSSITQQTTYEHPHPLSDYRKKSRTETDSPVYRHDSIPTSTSAESSPKQPSCGVDRIHIVSYPHEVRVYQNFLKARYQRNQFPTYFKQPSPSIKKFINLELVHKKRENKQERIQSMTAKLHGDVTKYKNERTTIDIKQIGEVGEDQKLPRNVLIEGDPGVGKTTLVWEMCKEWGEGTLLQQWDLVVLVQLRNKNIRRATNLRDFFKFSPDSPVNEIVYQHIRDTFGERVLIIFDGYDELSKLQKTETSIFNQILESTLLPSASIIVTSRPVATATLPDDFKDHTQQHIEVVGFTKRDIDKYIKCKFSNDPDLFKSFKDYISSHQFILTLMYVPLHCAIVTDLYHMYWRKGKRDFAPKTVTQLYACFLHSLLERYLYDHSIYGPQQLCIETLSDLPQDVYDDLMKLAQLAAKGIEEEQYVFDDLTCNTLGLMQSVDDNESHRSKSTSYSFLHLTLQEYLAALYWSTLPSVNTSYLFLESSLLPVSTFIETKGEFHNIHLPALLFYGGLTKVKGTPLEEILSKNNSCTYNFLCLLFETQNIEYISSILTDRTYQMKIKSHMESYVTGYGIANSSSTALWDIDIKETRFIKTLINGVNHATSSDGGSVSKLQISGRVLNSKHSVLLSELQRHMTKLSDLDFILDDISHDNFEKQIFGFCPALKNICIHAKKRLPSLNVFPKITCLHLKGAVVDDTVSTGLTNSITLKSLKFTKCDIVIDRQDVLPENSTLGNFTSDIAQPLAEELHYNTQIELLKLIHISDSKALNILMLELIQNKSVSSLELIHVKLDVEGGRTLRDIMRENTTLREMKIYGSIDSIDVAQPLAEGLQYNTGLHTLSLHYIYTSGVMKRLIEGLSCNNTIQTLVLDDNRMTIEDYRLLNNSILKKNQTLRNIVIFIREYHDHLAEELSDGLSVNIGLKNIFIYSFDLSCNDVKMLADSVMKNMNNIITITLPDKHSQDLSVYSYPKDRVKYMSSSEVREYIEFLWKS